MSTLTRDQLAGQIEWENQVVANLAREAGEARAAYAAAKAASDAYAAKSSSDRDTLTALRKARNDARRLLDERLYQLGDRLEDYRKVVLEYTESF